MNYYFILFLSEVDVYLHILFKGFFMNERNVLEILGKNMHEIRYKKNISLQELAEKINIDVEILRKFEAGECSGLNISQYIKIAEILGVNYKKLTKGIKFVED